MGSSASRLSLYRTRTFAFGPDPRGRLQSQPALLLKSSRRELSSAIGINASAKSSTSVALPLSKAGKRVLVYTAEEADRLASKPIGTEHLLLGLLREKSSDVLAALAAVGIDLRSARNRIREDRGLPTPDPEPDGKETSLRPLRPFAAFALMIAVLSLFYLLLRLVNS